MTTQLNHISVYGAGSWGTALALQLARNNLNVLLWERFPEQAKRIEQQRENKDFLPHIPFPNNLHCTSSLAQATAHSKNLLIAVPSEAFRSVLQKLAPLITAQHRIVWATKGLEVGTGYLLHQLVDEEIPCPIAYGVVSGPTFAHEVAQGLPTAMTVASNNAEFAQHIALAFQNNNFLVYTSDDVIGVELGGAIKNVLAIAAGISDGLGFGANARSAIITRGLAEMRRLGEKLGAKDDTLMGLAGIGDLVLTCTDNQSRNRRLGLALGRGEGLAQAIEAIGQAIEGLKSSHSIHLLAERTHIEMPICQQVHDILYANKAPQDAVKTLLSRGAKPEF